MKRYREVIRMPVLCGQKGKKLGVVEDLIVSLRTKQIKAIELKKKGYDIYCKGFLYESIVSFGRDAIIVKDFSCIKYLHNLGVIEPVNKKTSSNKEVICGRKVYTRTGKELGVVRDFLFDSSTGRIESIEVSDGIYEDIIKGRNILPLFGKVEFGEDNIMVGKEAIEEMISTGGGIKRKILGEI